MEKLQKTIFAWMFVLCVAAFAVQSARAVPVTATPAAAQKSLKNAPAAEQMDAPVSDHQLDEYRHSPAVQKLASKMHLSVETTAQLFEDLNSGLLLFVIFFFIFKTLPKVFKSRSERLARELVEAHNATEEANRRLQVIEERLSHLDADIASFRERSEREAAEEEKRIRESMEAERKRIIASVEREIEQAGAAAQRELTRYTAQLALAQARRELRVSTKMDEYLVADFGKSLVPERNGGAH